MKRRTTSQSPQFVSREISPSEIDRGIAKLKKRISEVEQLDPQALADHDPVGKKVERSIRDTVAEIFGEQSREAADFKNPSLFYHPGPQYLRGFGDPEPNNTPYYAGGIKKMVLDLNGLIEKLEERLGELSEDSPDLSHTRSATRTAATREVFIVHGHDEAAKQEVARFIEHIGLVPVILHEQTNRGSSTIIEKFVRHSNVPFAIVLLTPDDVGAQKSASDKLNPRARQNVVLELGYFLGRLGRDRVCALYKEGVEIPSDFSGVLYTPLDNHGGWKFPLAGELREVRPDIDLNKVTRR
jgi:predicted nucleotide-binding protein